jgi:hypothetical protein
MGKLGVLLAEVSTKGGSTVHFIPLYKIRIMINVVRSHVIKARDNLSPGRAYPHHVVTILCCNDIFKTAL